MDNLNIIDKIIKSKKVEVISHDSLLDEDKEDFIESLRTAIVEENKLVPVICEDMFEYKDPNSGIVQSLHSHCVQQIINSCHEPIKLTKSQLEDIINDEYYGMRLLEKRTKDHLRKPFHQILYASIDQNSHLKKEVKDFLITCKFPMVITTSCHTILEKELEGLRYESYFARQDGAHENEYYNNPANRKEVHSEKLPSRCIYHIFGKANTTKANWGYSDKQIMDYIRFALSDGPWKNLITSIKDKSLFFIGNNAPDWLFRFILAPIYGESVYNERSGYYLHLNNEHADTHLFYFLKDISYSKNSELSQILDQLTNQIKLIVANDDDSPKKKFKNDIFIAHASEDNNVVEKLRLCLESHGLKVYVDSKIEDGNYWSEIVDNLINSAYFMPFITEEYIVKAKKYKDRAQEYLNFGITDNIDVLLNHQDRESMDKVYNLSKALSGVAIELILAEHLLKSDFRKTYSIPIIMNGAFLKATDIEKRADGGALPKNLFSSQQMRLYYDGKSDPFDGKFSYDKYIQSLKSNEQTEESK